MKKRKPRIIKNIDDAFMDFSCISNSSPILITRKAKLWIVFMLCIFFIGVWIFLTGFLLNRSEIEEFNNQPISKFFKQEGRLILLLVDGLSWPLSQQLTSLNTKINQKNGRLVKFIADPPTTTLQRLKALLTGSMPTFIDIGSNFGGARLVEDNLIRIWKNFDKKILFTGDDIWLDLFPDPSLFTQTDGHESFNIRDLDTVDNAVKRFFNEKFSNGFDFDIMIGHLLGIDHCGHIFGRDHQEMTRKLNELNIFIKEIFQNLKEEDFLLIFGDHGMTNTGDHGGSSKDEIEAGLFLYCQKCKFDQLASSLPPEIWQIDLVPLLSMITAVPIPFSNLGVIQEIIIPKHLTNIAQEVCLANSIQIEHYLKSYEQRFGSIVQLSLNEKFANNSKNCFETATSILFKVRDTFREKWTRFDSNYISFGIFISTISILFLYGFDKFYNFFKIIFFVLFSFIFIFLHFKIFQPIPFILTLIFLIIFSNFLIRNQKQFSLNYSNILTSIILIAYFISFFSNSFLIQEFSIIVFLLITIVLFKGFRLFLVNHSFTDIFFCLLTIFFLRVSLNFEQCREESPKYSKCFHPLNLHKFSFFPSALMLAILFTYLPKYFLEINGNLLEHSNRQFARGNKIGDQIYSKLGILICSLFFISWLADSIKIHLEIAKDSKKEIPKFTRWALRNSLFENNRLTNIKVTTLQMINISALIGLILLYFKPLLLYVFKEKIQSYGLTEFQSASQSIYISGVSTPFSAWLILHLQYSIYFFLTILGPECLLPLVIFMLSTIFVLNTVTSSDIIVSKNINICGNDNTSLLYRISEALKSWSFALVIALLIQFAFFIVGMHQTTLSAIPWRAAFQVHSGDHLTRILPIILILSHMFCGPILIGLFLPLTAYLIALHKHADSRNALEISLVEPKTLLLEDGSNKVINFQLKSTIHLITMRVIIILLIWSVGSMIGTTILRRHLMVWKIFAPRMLYMLINTIITSIFLMIGNFLLVERTFNHVRIFTNSSIQALRRQNSLLT